MGMTLQEPARKRALVLSGGNLKGAWQAGALSRVLEEFEPDIITGVSVGALNAGMLTMFVGTRSWFGAGNALYDWWRDNVTAPSKFVVPRSALDLALRFLGDRWAGLIDMAPLRKVVAELMPRGAFDRWVDGAKQSVESYVGVCCLQTGDVKYVNLHATRTPVEWIMASTAEPITMPSVRINDLDYVDGGIRDIAPLRQAIELGATEIIVIACSPAIMPLPSAEWKPGSLLGQVSRTIGIVTHELLRSDLERAEKVNRAIASGMDLDHEYLAITVIRPPERLVVDKVTKFTAKDIQEMLTGGYNEADRIMDSYTTGLVAR